MRICFQKNGWADYLYWQQNDKKILKRINQLIRQIERNPFKGIGKPEALKFDMRGYWSRRIDSEHRLVYTMRDNDLIVVQCRYHY